MCNKQSINPKNLGLTPYQKRVVKALQKLLDTHTPFHFDKTTGNHLRVYIEGIDVPLTTSSTPSDRNSHKAFIARVKSQLRPRPVEQETTLIAPEIRRDNQQKALNEYIEQIKTDVVHGLRHRLPSLKEKEAKLFAQTQTTATLQSLRQEIINQDIDKVMRKRKSPVQLKPSVMRALEKEMLRHLTFMLPTLASYSDSLKTEKTAQLENEADIQQEQPVQPVLNTEAPVVEAAEVEVVETEPVAAPQLTLQQQFEQLHQQPVAARQQVFRQLSYQQLTMLIEEFSQALSLKQEDDLTEIMALVQRAGLPIEQVIARLQAAA